jgi:hypothetical protein
MYYIKDHYEATNKVIRLEDVPEEMYGGALPRARGRRSKRKMTAEEYLEVEKSVKKAKVASDKLKIDGSTMPSIEEAPTSWIAPDQPAIPKKKRKPAVRRIKDFPHVTEKAEAATASEAIGKAMEIAFELQEMVMTEASQLLTIHGTANDDHKRTAECSEPSTTGNVPSHKEPVVHEISSDFPSISLETSSSSSNSDDDKPIGHRYPNLINSQSTSAKTHTKPSQTSTYEPVGHIINEKLAEIAVRRDQVIDSILRHHPQPLNIQPLNMIAPDKDNLNPQTASEMTSEATASEKVISENSQQQRPEPQTSSPQQQPIVPEPSVPEPTVPEQTCPKQTVPEHIVSEQPVTKPVPEPEPKPDTETVAPEHPAPEPTQILPFSVPLQITRLDGISLATNMDTDSEDDQDDHASAMAIDPDQPSTSQSLTTNNQPPNLAIIPTALPKPSKQPSPPTIFLDPQVL